MPQVPNSKRKTDDSWESVGYLKKSKKGRKLYLKIDGKGHVADLKDVKAVLKGNKDVAIIQKIPEEGI
jgi:hypothetical protein